VLAVGLRGAGGRPHRRGARFPDAGRAGSRCSAPLSRVPCTSWQFVVGSADLFGMRGCGRRSCAPSGAGGLHVKRPRSRTDRSACAGRRRPARDTLAPPRPSRRCCWKGRGVLIVIAVEGRPRPHTLASLVRLGLHRGAGVGLRGAQAAPPPPTPPPPPPLAKCRRTHEVRRLV